MIERNDQGGVVRLGGSLVDRGGAETMGTMVRQDRHGTRTLLIWHDLIDGQSNQGAGHPGEGSLAPDRLYWPLCDALCRAIYRLGSHSIVRHVSGPKQQRAQ